MKYAYVTLLSSQEYLLGILVLNKSLKTVKSKYPLIVMITENIVSNKILSILQQENIYYYIIKHINYTSEVNTIFQKQPNVLNTASKIQILLLQNYDKLIFIDADSLILHNIDELFSKPNGSILYYEQTGSMSGLFVIIPKYHNYNYYKFLIENMTCTDGELIDHLFFPIKDNPNYKIPEIYLKNSLEIHNDYKGIHFGLKKKPFLIVNMKEILKYNSYSSYSKYFEYMLPLKQKYHL